MSLISVAMVRREVLAVTSSATFSTRRTRRADWAGMTETTPSEFLESESRCRHSGGTVRDNSVT